MSFVIVRQRSANTMWLVDATPLQWGKRERAMQFNTRRDARRAADAIKVSGDWSIEPAFPPPLTAS
jgi:hypothetical protein